MRLCPACGEENPPKFRLCGYCGAPFAAVAQPQDVRKIVTILFCDLKGSTNLGEQLDSESLRDVMSRYFAAMSIEIAKHGGTIEKFIGDAVMAVFGIPRVHEDDALRAVRAARGMQESLDELNEGLERLYGVRLANRIGVNTGEVVAGDATAGQRLVTGDAVNVAARLEQAAGENEVLLGPLTYRLVRARTQTEALEPLELKGKAERVSAYRLRAIIDGPVARAATARPTVGRAEEMLALESAFALATDHRRCELVTVVGEAGLGKSRLLDEFRRRVAGRADVLSGACLSYGDGVTFWPLVEAVREAAGIDADDDRAVARAKLAALGGADIADRVGSAVGLSDDSYPVHEIFWAVRKLVQTLASERPLVLVLEDLHWAEPTLLDLVDAVAGGIEDAPVLVVAAGRPELAEARPEWLQGRHISLRPLADVDSEQIVDHALGGAPIAAAARRRIIDAAAGNPLFVEQLVSMMIEGGLLRQDRGTWELEDLPAGWVPPTVHALLSARLDQLGPEEHAVIDPAAVIGFHFSRSALQELVAEPVRDDLDKHLTILSGKQLIRIVDDDTYRFDHVLIRESAYDGVLKRARASLHERFVVWADRVNGDRAVEFEEILGYHLEQAYRYLVELAPIDDHALGLGRDGGRRLAAAGRRALERGDMPAAARLLLRATALLPPLDPDRLRLFPDLGDALIQIGSVAEAESLLEDAIAAAELAGDAAAAAVARIPLMLVQRLSGDAGTWNERAMDAAREAIATCAEAGDAAGLSRAWRLVASVEGNACRLGAAVDALEQALEHARAAGDARQERRGSTVYALLLAYGPTAVDDAIARCEEIADRVRGDRQAEAALLCVLGHLHALHGDFDAARNAMRTSRALFDELGLRIDAAVSCIQASHVEFLAGDPQAAEAELRRGYEVLDGLGDHYWLPSVAGLLAQAMVAAGRLDEAKAMTRVAEQRARADDVDAQALWRCARAKVDARRGDAAGAEALVREALRLLAPTDAIVVQVTALADAADVLVLCGRPDSAASALEQALDLARAKQSPILISRLEDALHALRQQPVAEAQLAAHD
jgi:class 3 adenylate cyclase/tetratricopeptide (TPR) repeat protein